MLFAAARQGARRQTLNAVRNFTSSTSALAPAEVKKLGVIGAGQMVSFLATIQKRHWFICWTSFKGLGIALVAAQKAEIPVVLIDNSETGLQKGIKFAGKSTFCGRYANCNRANRPILI